MKFGVREICDVVLKAKATMTVGKKTFYANEPVIYFDTLKTSSMEGAATTVYAQGGRGNSRLVAWEGERTVTFTMEDALISPEGFMILSGAGLVAASDKDTIYQHVTETIDAGKIKKLPATGDITDIVIPLSNDPAMTVENVNGYLAYVMFVKNGEVVSEPYIPTKVTSNLPDGMEHAVTIKPDDASATTYKADAAFISDQALDTTKFDSVIVDYYVAKTSGAQQIEIEAGKFGGNFYLEASTLFRDQNGSDLPAEFIIPNCKIQSNFTFTMASSGDPSTFTFTMDAFPDYTRFDHSKKVLAAIQIINADGNDDDIRTSTYAGYWAPTTTTSTTTTTQNNGGEGGGSNPAG